MSETTPDQEEHGFAFTDEDYDRRYSLQKRLEANPAIPSPPAAKPSSGLHGGGNSFMRARRRRLAAAGSAHS